MVEGWGKLPPILGKFENWNFFSNFGLLLVETINPCVGFFLHNSTEPLLDYGLRKLERNRMVRIRDKFVRISEKRL